MSRIVKLFIQQTIETETSLALLKKMNRVEQALLKTVM